MNATMQRFAGLAATTMAVVMLASPAFADGMRRGSIKDAPQPEQRRCNLSANVALTTEYVFRGVSQTAQDPAIQGGFDVTCGMFYAGVWASNLNFAGDSTPGPDNVIAHIEMDWYAGIKGTRDRISWDVGVIYYSYPGQSSAIPDLNYVELKFGAAAQVWKDTTMGVTVFYSPDYTGESGETWTVEGTFARVLPKFDRFTPTFSALIGWQHNEGHANYIAAFGDDHYMYWNAGLTLAFHEKWSLDLRYWDTNINNGFCSGAILQCDERFVATLKFTY